MLLNKDNLPLVDMDFMNETHFEDVDLLNELFAKIEEFENDSSDKNFEILKLKYKEWVNHTVNHFATEEEEMQKKGFFAYPFHKGEHDNNLAEIRAVWDSFEHSKNIEELKNYIEFDVINWLINHIQSMDTVTARFFKTGMSPCAMM
ncbi:hemerythrin family protein [Aliarcobacter lanthieri]|uniref:hemerythrin family protein n=1 Tax=Aliarcobacter lanthieri TaxID=1355374 RepID=UPI00047B4F0D|nr:hemerythrin family protein [Aliarcobacter lanthieri]